MSLGFLHGRAIKVALVLLPAVVPAVYLYRFARSVSSKTTSTTGRRSSGQYIAADESLCEPVSLPDDVKGCSQWELAYERIISHPIPTSSLVFPITESTKGASDDGPSPLMRAYVCAAQLAFGQTPQAILMRGAIADPQTKRTFDGGWIQTLRFEKGDVVNGAYRVVYHGTRDITDTERVELAIEAPPSYKGHVPQGLIVSEIQKVDNGHGQAQAVFINETWMWRRSDEKKTLIETPMGSYFHCLTVGWLVIKGIEQVIRH